MDNLGVNESIESIIEKICLEVFQTLEKKMDLDQFEKVDKTTSDCNLIIIPKYVINLEKMITRTINESKGGKFTILATKQILNNTIISNNIKQVDIDNEEDKLNLLKNFELFNQIICIEPSIDMLRSIVHLTDNHFSTYVVLQSLLYGKKVKIVLNNNILNTPTNPIQQKYNELINEAREKGITINDTWTACCSKKVYNKNLISESNIDEIVTTNQKVIHVDHNTIITPLAKDRARELGIIIKY